MTSDSLPTDLRLAAPPDKWEVTLHTGDKLQVMAHAYSVEGPDHVFSLLMEGAPRFEVPVLRVPSEIIQSVFGG
jgi:hypothetical protein